jgi:hypothetical protein
MHSWLALQKIKIATKKPSSVKPLSVSTCPAAKRIKTRPVGQRMAIVGMLFVIPKNE